MCAFSTHARAHMNIFLSNTNGSISFNVVLTMEYGIFFITHVFSICKWNIQIFFVMFSYFFFVLLQFDGEWNFFPYFHSLSDERIFFPRPSYFRFYVVGNSLFLAWFLFLCLRHISRLQTNSHVDLKNRERERKKKRRYNFWPKYIRSYPFVRHIKYILYEWIECVLIFS